MIHNNVPAILIAVFVMGVQANLFFNSVFGKLMQRHNRLPYFMLFGLLYYVYLSIPLSTFFSSVLPVLMIFSFALSYNVEIKTKIIFSLLYSVLISIANFISLHLLYTLDAIEFDSITPFTEQDPAASIKLILLISIIMFPVIQLVRLVARRRSFPLPYRYYGLFLIIPVISIYHISIFTYKNVYYLISILGLLLLNIMIVYVFDTIMDKFQFMHVNDRLQKQMDYQDANYEKVVHSFKSIKRIIHDTNQQFLYIEECIKRNEPASALEHIQTTLNKIEDAYQRINTGNLVIDALVTNTLTIGQANGIRIDTRLNLRYPELPIDRYDLCVVMGNMLDNAVEASKQVKLAEDRYILIKIHSTESTLLIHILNHIDHATVPLHSQKPDQEFHGIGLTNIARICDKYGGHMTIETKSRQFNNMVLLPFSTNNP